jgi:hypothetical protein
VQLKYTESSIQEKHLARNSEHHAATGNDKLER